MATKADFTLMFHADGSVELLARDGSQVWSSDSDDDFMEDFDGQTDFNDDDDSDDILDYLDEAGYVDLDEDKIDIVENDLEDEAASDKEYGDVIEGEFTEAKPRGNKRRK